jgi:hypothetical protein
VKNPILGNRARDLTGKRFGRLVALEPARQDRRQRWRWACMCDCGRVVEVQSHHLVAMDTQSCGCLAREKSGTHEAAFKPTHGMWNTPEYDAYHHAKCRCNNPRHRNYKDYGGRGILFLFTSFEEFYAELGPRPNGRTLDRIENDGNYEPGNVRWATRSQQQYNRRPYKRTHELAAQAELAL